MAETKPTFKVEVDYEVPTNALAAALIAERNRIWSILLKGGGVSYEQRDLAERGLSWSFGDYQTSGLPAAMWERYSRPFRKDLYRFRPHLVATIQHAVKLQAEADASALSKARGEAQ